MDAYDLAALLRFRERLQSIPPDRPAIVPLAPLRPGRAAFMSGSFNPPTAAHLLLAERALAESFDVIVFVLPVAPAGKKPSGLCNEDRLLALHLIADPHSAVAVTNAPLYFEQAEAARRLTGDDASPVTMIAGSDKLVQIFDGTWYDDRDSALERLFACARMLVSPRAGDGDAVGTLIDNNGRYAHRITVLPLHPAVGDLSATRVRGLLTSGADPAGLVPSAVAAFCAETRAFAPPDPETGIDAYAIRVRAIELLATLGTAAERADLRAVVKAALSRDDNGTRLRHALAHGDAPALLNPAAV